MVTGQESKPLPGIDWESLRLLLGLRPPPSPRYWPVAFIPEIVGPQCRLPDDAVIKYCRIRWFEDCSRPHLDIVSDIAWSAPSADGTDVGIEVHAVRGGVRAASSLWAIRHTGGEPAHGHRDLPKPPDVGQGIYDHDLVVSEGLAAEFGRIVAPRFTVMTDILAAHHRGFANVLVGGLLLLLLEQDRRPLGPRGALEMWWLEPIPAGCVISAFRTAADPDLLHYRLPGRAAPAAILRVGQDPDEER